MYGEHSEVKVATDEQTPYILQPLKFKIMVMIVLTVAKIEVWSHYLQFIPINLMIIITT